MYRTRYFFTVCFVGALESLSKELVPNTYPGAAASDYRKSLALSLFYKVSAWFSQATYNYITSTSFIIVLP